MGALLPFYFVVFAELGQWTETRPRAARLVFGAALLICLGGVDVALWASQRLDARGSIATIRHVIQAIEKDAPKASRVELGFGFRGSLKGFNALSALDSKRHLRFQKGNQYRLQRRDSSAPKGGHLIMRTGSSRSTACPSRRPPLRHPSQRRLRPPRRLRHRAGASGRPPRAPAPGLSPAAIRRPTRTEPAPPISRHLLCEPHEERRPVDAAVALAESNEDCRPVGHHEDVLAVIPLRKVAAPVEGQEPLIRRVPDRSVARLVDAGDRVGDERARGPTVRARPDDRSENHHEGRGGRAARDRARSR